jgi:hypothetical protein
VAGQIHELVVPPAGQASVKILSARSMARRTSDKFVVGNIRTGDLILPLVVTA